MPARVPLTALAALTMLAACTESPAPPPEESATESASAVAEAAGVEWALAVHGGAGNIGRDMDEARQQAVREALGEALRAGSAILESGGSALDAAIMDGRTLSAGAEAFAETVGAERVDPSYFDTERRRQSLEEAIEREKETLEWTGTVGTVGAADSGGRFETAI